MLERPARVARLAVAAARHERSPDTHRGRGAQHVGVHRARRADEDEIGLPGGHLPHVPVGLEPQDLGPVAVHGTDGTTEAVAEEVVERDEAELARVVRGSRHDDAAWMEEGPEALEHDGARPGSGRRARGPLTGGIENHQRIDGDWQGTSHDERVHVDAQDVVALERQAGEAEEDPHEGFDIERGLTAKRLEEETMGAELGDHAPPLARRERGGGEDDVAQPLRQDSPQPEHHARAERRVAHHAGHELAAPAHLLGDQQLHVAVLGPAEPVELARRRPYRGRVGEAEADEITLGLVENRFSAELQHHREADLLGGTCRSRAIGDEDLSVGGYAVAGEEHLGVVLGERGSRGRAPGSVHAAWDHCVFASFPEERQAQPGLPPVSCRGYARGTTRPPPERREGGRKCRGRSGTEPYLPRATTARWWKATATFLPTPSTVPTCARAARTRPARGRAWRATTMSS